MRRVRNDWVRGSASAANTLIEYGDFECPTCGAAYWEVKHLLASFGRELAFAFRHFPLAELHPNAELAAEAAEAAGEQGQFWELHDLMFEHQDDLEPASLVNFAGSLGLDVDRFIAELNQGVYQPAVRRDFMDGVRHGVSGTPTFFVNGERYAGPPNARGLERALRGQPPGGAFVW